MHAHPAPGSWSPSHRGRNLPACQPRPQHRPSPAPPKSSVVLLACVGFLTPKPFLPSGLYSSCSPPTSNALLPWPEDLTPSIIQICLEEAPSKSSPTDCPTSRLHMPPSPHAALIPCRAMPAASLGYYSYHWSQCRQASAGTDFTNSSTQLNLICNLHIGTFPTFTSFTNKHRTVRILSFPKPLFPAEGRQGDACFLSSALTRCNQESFPSSIQCPFFPSLGVFCFCCCCRRCCCCCWFLFLECPPTSSLVLSDVPECSKTGVLPENLSMCDGFHLGVSHRAAGHDFNVNGSTIYIK